MELGVLLDRLKGQYTELLISSGLASESQRKDIFMKLDKLHDGRIVDGVTIGNAMAEIKLDKNNAIARVEINEQFVDALKNSNGLNDESLDRFRQVMFHEFTHVLQASNDLSRVGYMQNIEDSDALNEVAAQRTEQIVMAQFYRDVRGMKNAGILTGEIRDNGRSFRAYGPVQDTNSRDQFNAGAYYREMSLAEDALKPYGVSLDDVARLSFDFNASERKDLIGKTPKIEQIANALNSVLVFYRQGHEVVVTAQELNDALNTLSPLNNGMQTFNEFGEIVRNEQSYNRELDIPVFTPPVQNAPDEPMFNEFGEIVRNEQSYVQSVPLGELEAAKEALGILAPEHIIEKNEEEPADLKEQNLIPEQQLMNK